MSFPTKIVTAGKLGLLSWGLPGALLLQWFLRPFLSSQGAQKRSYLGDGWVFISNVHAKVLIIPQPTCYLVGGCRILWLSFPHLYLHYPFPYLSGPLHLLWCLLVLVGSLKFYMLFEWKRGVEGKVLLAKIWCAQLQLLSAVCRWCARVLPCRKWHSWTGM